MICQTQLFTVFLYTLYLTLYTYFGNKLELAVRINKITEMESEILDKTKEVSRLETEIQVKNDLGR